MTAAEFNRLEEFNQSDQYIRCSFKTTRMIFQIGMKDGKIVELRSQPSIYTLKKDEQNAIRLKMGMMWMFSFGFDTSKDLNI